MGEHIIGVDQLHTLAAWDAFSDCLNDRDFSDWLEHL